MATEISRSAYAAKDADLWIRAFGDEVLQHQAAGKSMIDVRCERRLSSWNWVKSLPSKTFISSLINGNCTPGLM